MRDCSASFVALLALLGLPVPLLAQIQYGQIPGAQERRTLLLRDFKPRSMLRAAAHAVSRARFPVIDIHSHLNDAMGINPDKIPPAEAVAMMDRCNIRKICILTGMWGDKLQNVLDEMVKPYPDRFVVFSQIDWSRAAEPGFVPAMVKQIDDSVRRGARGLKVLKDLGLEDRDASGKLFSVDDPRLGPIWEECGRLGIPVAIHTADPEAFFEPADGTNELYEALAENPTWSFSDRSKFPSFRELLDQQRRLFDRHPKTTFIALHMANWPDNLDYVAELLDHHPNVVVEFGAREQSLGRQPRRTRRLSIDYQDRVLFGTDYSVSDAMYQNHFRWLETADEYFEPVDYPFLGRWMIYGLELPDVVLEKIYHLNAERILGQFKGLEGGR